MNEEQKEKFGELIDEFENLVFALKTPFLPAEIHLEGVRGALPEKVEELKKLYIEITGDNPWED